MDKRTVRASIVISCDIVMDDVIRQNVEDQSAGAIMSDDEIAGRILFAFLNPKIDAFNYPDAISGNWEMICEFRQILRNFNVEVI